MDVIWFNMFLSFVISRHELHDIQSLTMTHDKQSLIVSILLTFSFFFLNSKNQQTPPHPLPRQTLLSLCGLLFLNIWPIASILFGTPAVPLELFTAAFPT